MAYDINDHDLKRRVEDLEAWLFGADAEWELGGPDSWEEQLLKPKDRLEQAAALKKRIGGLKDDESLHLAGTVNPWTPFQMRLLYRAWQAAWGSFGHEADDAVSERVGAELRAAIAEDKALPPTPLAENPPGSRLAVRACQCGLDLLERRPGGIARKRRGKQRERGSGGRERAA
jgi:hypothetical protein